MLFTRALRRLKRANFKKNRNYIAGVVICVGILISIAIFSFPSLGRVPSSIAMNNIKWSEATGLGISVPACSSVTGPTCVGPTPSVTLRFISHADSSFICENRYLTMTIYDLLGSPVDSNSGYGCWATWIWNGGVSNTDYTYTMVLQDGAAGYTTIQTENGSFPTPNCVPLPSLDASCSVSPTSAAIGDNVTWTAIASGGTPPYSYAWSGDAPLGGSTGTVVTVQYLSSGLKTGAVTVTDTVDTVGPIACSNNVSIGGAFSPPVVYPGTSHTPLLTGSIHVHAGASTTDSDGNLSSYTWSWVSFPAGYVPPALPAGVLISGGSVSIPGPTYPVSLSGDYTIQLSVSDSAGMTTSQNLTETAVAAPAVYPGPSHTLTVSTAHTHAGASATDSDGNLASYSWTWVLCPAACPLLTGSSGLINGSSAAIPGPGYTPLDPGFYRLRLTVKDLTNLSRSAILDENTRAITECNDASDNDGDGRVDYPGDPGCSIPGDNSEDDSIPDFIEVLPQ